MANIWYGDVKTEDKYVDLSTISEVTFVEGTVYMVQPVGVCTFCIATSTPTKGGNTIWNNQMARFKLAAGEKLYVRTYDKRTIQINISR